MCQEQAVLFLFVHAIDLHAVTTNLGRVAGLVSVLSVAISCQRSHQCKESTVQALNTAGPTLFAHLLH